MDTVVMESNNQVESGSTKTSVVNLLRHYSDQQFIDCVYNVVIPYLLLFLLCYDLLMIDMTMQKTVKTNIILAITY
jgi:hypothetical protein